MEHHNKKWSNTDIIYLIESYKQNKETTIIANDLKRTSSAILAKLKQVLKKVNVNYNEDYNNFIQNQINNYIDDIYKEYSANTIIKPIANDICKDVLNDIIDIVVDQNDLNEKQLEGYNKIKQGQNIFLTGEAGCHAYDTDILMFDGSIKKVQDIKDTDIIMGDDSTPRNIIKLVKGFDQMYKIHHVENDESYIVNKDHILTLVYDKDKDFIKTDKHYIIKYFNNENYSIQEIKYPYNQFNNIQVYNKAKTYFDSIIENKLVDISVSDYLNLKQCIKEHLFGIKTYVKFPEQLTYYDPYYAGSMYGINTLSFTDYNIEIYIINSFEIRLDFLSGVVDAYGGTHYDNFIIPFYEHNSGIDKILFIIKSLNLKYKVVNNYIYIHDNINSKKYGNIITNSDYNKYTIYKINVEMSKPSMFYGFKLDNNHRYLTADMIITHNCGKTYLIKKTIKYFKSNNKKIGVTGSTGVSASLINGTTLHSFLGIGLGKKTVEELYKHIKDRSPLTFKKIQNLQILIIDEISMIDNILFSKIAKLISLIQNVNKPFGRLQLIICGDFGQLKPVNNTYCFESSIWNKLNFKVVTLTEQIRQNGDNEFKSILSKLRLGEIDDEIFNRLKLLKYNKFDGEVKPTILYSLNRDIDVINNREYQKQLNKSGREYIFPLKYNEFCPKTCKYVNSLAIKEIKLCVGLQVMVTFNIDVENHLVNGTRCVITDIFDSFITVKTVNGNMHTITYITYTDDIDEDIHYDFMPLKLAYAISIHKSQGSTIDLLEMDLGSSVFEYGQGYTSLSRGTSLNSIKLLALSENSFRAHPKVIEFYNKIQYEENDTNKNN